MTFKTPEKQVILIDDDATVLKALTQSFEIADIPVRPFQDPKSALTEISANFSGVVVSDIRMSGIDGTELFERIKALDSDIPVILITGHADVPMVLTQLKKGVFDFLTKPINRDELISSVEKAIELRHLKLENRHLRFMADQSLQNADLIGQSAEIEKVRATIKQISKIDIDVLIEGEAGTGKNLVAKQIHKLSNRARHKFVELNCSALPAELFDGEFFGFSAASNPHIRREHVGLLERSDRGTLYLEQINDLSLDAQGQLVPVIDKRQFTPIGAIEPKGADFRTIVSSSSELSKLEAAGKFRTELYYRLNTVKIVIPPLRERLEDISVLFSVFTEQASETYNKKLPKLGRTVRSHLFEHHWPGNVRELKNYAESLVLGINTMNEANAVSKFSLPERVERFESATIQSVLRQTNGNVKASLDILKIPRKTFYDKVSRHKLDLNEYRGGTS